MTSPRPAKRAPTTRRPPRTRTAARAMRAVTRSVPATCSAEPCAALALGHRDGVARRAARRQARTAKAPPAVVARVPHEAAPRVPSGRPRPPRARARAARRARHAGRAATARPASTGSVRTGSADGDLHRIRRASRRSSTRTVTGAPSSARPAGTRAIAVRPSAESRVSSVPAAEAHLGERDACERIRDPDADSRARKSAVTRADRRAASQSTPSDRSTTADFLAREIRVGFGCARRGVRQRSMAAGSSRETRLSADGRTAIARVPAGLALDGAPEAISSAHRCWVSASPIQPAPAPSPVKTAPKPSTKAAVVAVHAPRWSGAR